MDDIQVFLQKVTITAIPALLAITFHEAAHGWVAYKKGDPTARMLGRVTLNPLAHIDPVGTILLPLLFMFSGGGWFGWAKPVPVNFRLLRDQKRDPVYVASAGVVTNLALAAISGILLSTIGMIDQGTIIKVRAFGMRAQASGSLQMGLIPLALMCIESVRWNVALAIFNLIPIPPLDGGRIAVGLLPPGPSQALASVERYGMIILIALLFIDPFGIIWRVITPIMHLLISMFLSV